MVITNFRCLMRAWNSLRLFIEKNVTEILAWRAWMIQKKVRTDILLVKRELGLDMNTVLLSYRKEYFAKCLFSSFSNYVINI
jgi:hypothetical protein